MTIVKVQDCGCIALPEEIAAATGLNPGATLSIELTPDKSAVLIKPIERTEPHPPPTGEQCN
jgi:bifunctional DNA-binding transcriptional regulator/antitoxin component of YhaV-PrlF toxin-antitoxin module